LNYNALKKIWDVIIIRKTGIYLTIGLLIALFPALFKSLGDYIVEKISNISEWYADKLIAMAVDNDPYWFVTDLYFLLIMIIIWHLVGDLHKLQTKQKEINRLIAEIEIEKAGSPIHSLSKKNEFSLESAKQSARKAKYITRCFIGFFTLAYLYFTAGMTTHLAASRINIEIQRNFAVLAPYTPDHELKLLRLRWAFVSSKKDFDKFKVIFDKHLDEATEKMKQEFQGQ
jgi:hypothetical protein